MLYSLSRGVKRCVPEPLLHLARTLGVSRVLGGFYSELDLERAYQSTLAHALRSAPGWEARLLEYWRTWRLYDRLLERARPEASTPIVDVGCGLLSVLRFLPGLRVGVDVNAGLYQSLLPWPQGVELRVGRGECLPLPSGWAKIAVCSNALDHMSDPEKAMDELARVLQPGGILLMTVEVFDGDVPDRGVAHPHSLTTAQARALFRRAAELQEERLHDWSGLRELLLNVPELQEVPPRREWVGLGVRAG